MAVYRHQVEACVAAGPALLEQSATARAALASWIDLFVDFLAAGEIVAGVDALVLMHGIDNLCIGVDNLQYDARQMVGLVIAGLRLP